MGAAWLFTGAALGADPSDRITASPRPADAVETCLGRQAAVAEPEKTARELRRLCSSPGAFTRGPSESTDSADSEGPGYSPFEHRFRSEMEVVGEPFALLPHRPNYLLPVSWVSRRDPATALIPFGTAQKDVEATFQISFKFPVAPPLFGHRAALFFGYTGRSWWQVYDSAQSRPFREYNHEPELLLAVLASPTASWFGWRHRTSGLSLNHQSNGRSLPYSRSWNRVIGEVLFDHTDGPWARVRLWHRFAERPKANPDDTEGDDNPDIVRYMGRGEVQFGYAGKSNLTLTLRGGAGARGKGSVQLDWSRPTGFARALRWHLQYFDGYGDSLVDYNTRLSRIGLGVMLNDWL